MSLNFPNPSCSFEAMNHRVAFWGYDNVMEISFFVEVGALRKLCPEIIDAEAGFLEAFDTMRNRIYAVAGKIYARGRKGIHTYILAAEDF